MRALGVAVLVTWLLVPASARAVPYDERPAWQRAGYTTLAMIANVVPITSALVAPRCLPGYILCKISYAGMSVVAAAEVMIASGDHDIPQIEGILHRGFAGDWYLTGRHVAGDVEPNVLPEPVPRSPSNVGETPTAQ